MAGGKLMSAYQPLLESFAALEKDLTGEEGPRISSIRNYQFAILPYDPKQEFEMRRQLQSLCRRLEDKGWSIASISLLQLLMKRLREQGGRGDYIQKLIDREKRFSKKDIQRGLNELQQRLGPHLEGSEGIAKDCAEIIHELLEKNDEANDRTVVFIGRAGALYPFFRSSGLLRHLHSHLQHNLPVILLYPGSRHGDAGLSFMNKLNPDRDYRPRIYG
jgi:hypothetical protein